jgi:Tfp pilus assembly protein PilN
MSQQINLLNPSLIKQKDFLNTNTIAIIIGILLASMLGYYGYAQKQLSVLITQRSQIADELSATKAHLEQTVLLHTQHDKNKALLAQIMQLEQKEIMQQQILQTVKLSSATPEKGYAALMHAFAKQSVDGLWLTSFSIDSSTENLNISGRTLQADLVPEYITRLGNEPALKGKLFSALNMSLPKIEFTSNTPATVTTPPTTIASIVKNGVAVIPVNSNTTGSLPQRNEPKYIEFVLQSTDEKPEVVSASNVTNSNVGGKL